MIFVLVGQIIRPENDGGIQICYRGPAKKTTLWNKNIPLLSIEVPTVYKGRY